MVFPQFAQRGAQGQPKHQDAEEFLSTWIRKQNKFDGFVGSKWGYEYLANWEINAEIHERKDHSAAFLKHQWIETRLNLGKSIDLYHIHSVTPDSKVLDDPAVIAELETIKKKGYRYWHLN
jgi:aryl-alcohol dehydrogenase-like predicted oxidoreductase